MGMESIWCRTLSGDVTRVTDLEGAVTEMICPEYDAADGSCRLKQRALDAGPLGQLLERQSADGWRRRSTQCHLRGG
jgi:hypothetical protein